MIDRKGMIDERVSQLMAVWARDFSKGPGSLEEHLAIEVELEQRRQVRAEENFRADIERATWLCPYCGRIHEPLIHELSGRVRLVQRIESCSCERAQDERSRRVSEIQAQEFARRMAFLEGLPSWQDFNVDWPPTEKAKDQLRAARDHVYNWFAGGCQDGLILTGGVGCGKSHLLRTVVAATRFQGRSVFFITEPDLLALLTANQGQEVLDKCRGADILAIDDVGSRQFNSTSEWAKHMLQAAYFQILEHRNSRDRVSIFSTNHRFSELAAVVGERAHDRLYAIVRRRDNILGLWDVPTYRRKDF